jgi:hypothetical protein
MKQSDRDCLNSVVGVTPACVVLGTGGWLVRSMRTCVVEKLEESRVYSASRTSGRKVEPSGWTVVLQVHGDFALVCIAHGKDGIFQGTGVEILLLDWRDDGDIGKISVPSFLMKSGLVKTRSQRLFPIVVGCSFVGNVLETRMRRLTMVS